MLSEVIFGIIQRHVAACAATVNVQIQGTPNVTAHVHPCPLSHTPPWDGESQTTNSIYPQTYTNEESREQRVLSYVYFYSFSALVLQIFGASVILGC